MAGGENNKPIIVAQIMGKWVGGGVEAVIMNYYRHIDRTKVQFDFICDEDSTNIPYDEIEKLGGKVILCPPYQKLGRYMKFLENLFREKKYRIVHSNINTLSVFPLRAAKKAGAPVRIAHSHSTSNPKEWKKNLLKNTLRPFSRKYATDYFACSELAGRYLFGNKKFDAGKVKIIHNAIDVKKYKFDPKARDEIRKEIGLKENDFVVGHVGRFVKQKNHAFLLDIFVELKKDNEHAKLVLVGEGPLKEKMKDDVKKLDLANDVHFVGQREDVEKVYSAFDEICFPSLYEGLGMVCVEAQANGLPCITSTSVPPDVAMAGNVKRMSLSQSEVEWSREIEANKDRIKNVNIGDEYNINIRKDDLVLLYYSAINKKIELFGIPGSGKSTYAKNVLTEYDDYNERYIPNNRMVRRIKGLLDFVYMIITHNSILRKYIKMLRYASFKNNSLKVKFIIYFSTIYRLELKAKRSKEKIVLDEGLLQVLWGICYCSECSVMLIRTYLDAFECQIADSVIQIEEQQETIISRLKDRTSKGGSELEHDIKKDPSAIKKAERAFTLIMNEVQKKPCMIINAEVMS